MIDRDARTRLSTIVRRFLNEQIKSFAFDEGVDEFRDSKDSAVRFVSYAVWYHYDDCEDHLGSFSKPQWDYFQRLLLLLESNSTVTTTRFRHWSIFQFVAAVLLFFCALTASRTGIGSHIFVFFVPFGIGSIILSKLHRVPHDTDPYADIVAPFHSIGDLRLSYESASFRKQRFPRKLSSRRIRSPFMDWFWRAYFYIMWTILAPIPLLLQCLPSTTTKTTVHAA